MVKRALCIGINDYPGDNNDLSGCINDANDWKDILSSREFSQITSLLDEEAVKNNIVTNIKSLLKQSKSGDTAVITYSGHGTWLPDFNHDEIDRHDECICPWDVINKGLLITDDELSVLFSAVKPGVQLIFISDACNSGTLTRCSIMGSGTHRVSKIRYLPLSNFIDDKKIIKKAQKIVDKRKAKIKNDPCLLLSGCKDNEYSYDAYINDRYNGAFTRAALDTLATSPKNYKQWYNRIRQLLPSRYYPQTPQLSGTIKMIKWRLF